MKAFILGAIQLALSLKFSIAHPTCNVCGVGNQIVDHNEVFSFPSLPEVKCGLLEKAGLEGKIPESQCGFLPDLVKNKCGCQVIPKLETMQTRATESTIKDGECVCYGDITPNRYLFQKSIRKHVAKGEKEATNQNDRSLATPPDDENCVCVEKCDDDDDVGDDSVKDDAIPDDDCVCECYRGECE
jgi:hypothetical protein